LESDFPESLVSNYFPDATPVAFGGVALSQKIRITQMTHSLLRAAALAVMLAPCTILGGCNLRAVNTKITADASASLSSICPLGVSTHAAFSIVAATGKLTSKVVADESAAFTALQSLCANPPTNAAAAITQAAAIYASIANFRSAAAAIN
jgi:hypothetical protein